MREAALLQVKWFNFEKKRGNFWQGKKKVPDL